MENNCDDKNESVAFTINFIENNPSVEKSKKFERFVHRSSLRQKNLHKDEKCENKENKNVSESNEVITERRKLTRSYSLNNKENMRIPEEKEDDKDKQEYSIDDLYDDLSQAGTYTMENDQDDMQVLPAPTAPDDINLPETGKASLIGEWTARHGLSAHHKRISSSRRKLPTAPGSSSPESSDESLNYSVGKKEEAIDSRKDNSKRNVNLSLKTMGPARTRSVRGSRESLSSRFHSSQEGQIKRPIGRLEIRSSSHLSSTEQHFSTWKKNKDEKTEKNQSYTHREQFPTPDCKQPLRMTQSLTTSCKGRTVRRTNSLYQNNSVRDCKINAKDPYQSNYREENSEEEIILPPYPDNSPAASVSSLDKLVISTLHNVSAKLCLTAAKIVRRGDILTNQDDDDQALAVETVAYLLEDTDMAPGYKNTTSSELAGTLKKLKKLEQALILLTLIFNDGEQ